MKKNDVDSFDLINISFLLLHLEDPSKVIRTLKKVLSKNGSIVITDVDDGLLTVYPDNELIFKKALEILSKHNTSGYRESGREIYYILKRADINDVSLRYSGLSSIGAPLEIREDLFQTYFELIPLLLEETLEVECNNASAISDREWFKSNSEKIESDFYSSEFMMIAGMVIFTAK